MIVSASNFSDELYSLWHGVDQSSTEPPSPDVRIVTSNGQSIPVHSGVLASVSTVMEKILCQPRKRSSSDRVIPILGVSTESVLVFLKFLYSSRCSEEEMEKNGIHLLTLSHVYSVTKLKQSCTKVLASRLTMENVIDVLQLARLCDAPDLYLKCLKLVNKNFKAVEATEGWTFLHEHDPWLELDILQFQDEVDSREKQRRKRVKEQRLYEQLSEAMECLEHICTEGCTSVGPHDKEPTKNKKPCSKFSTCQGIQLSIRHFASCTKKVNGGCARCKRMWQLLRLHSSICDQHEQCRVPLCSQFKLKMKQHEKGDNVRWRLLAKKVVSAKVMASISLSMSTRLNQRRLRAC